MRIDSGWSGARDEFFIYAAGTRTSPPRDGESVSPYQRMGLGRALNPPSPRRETGLTDYLADVLESRLSRLSAAR